MIILIIQPLSFTIAAFGAFAEAYLWSMISSICLGKKKKKKNAEAIRFLGIKKKKKKMRLQD